MPRPCWLTSCCPCSACRRSGTGNGRNLRVCESLAPPVRRHFDPASQDVELHILAEISYRFSELDVRDVPALGAPLVQGFDAAARQFGDFADLQEPHTLSLLLSLSAIALITSL